VSDSENGEGAGKFYLLSNYGPTETPQSSTLHSTDSLLQHTTTKTSRCERVDVYDLDPFTHTDVGGYRTIHHSAIQNAIFLMARDA